jgi:hypothetical protein
LPFDTIAEVETATPADTFFSGRWQKWKGRRPFIQIMLAENSRSFPRPGRIDSSGPVLFSGCKEVTI